MKRVLVAGIGNLFEGDDAFGVAVAQELARRSWPATVEIKDFGIRAYDLAYALADDYETIVLVDAVPRGQAPGTLYLLEPELSALEKFGPQAVDGHSLNLVAALQMAQALGEIKARILLLGCEPVRSESEDGSLGLSPPVQAAVPAAVERIALLVDSLLGETQTANAGVVPA